MMRVKEASSSTLPLRSLRAISAVCELGSIAGATRLLHLSPAAISRAIADAERVLGVQLFDRSRRGMRPTAEGTVLATRVRRALEALNVAAEGLRRRGADPSVMSLPRVVTDTLLQAFLARAGHSSESAAAEAVGLSQPAMNQALRRLEHNARVPLYQRSHLGNHLNEAGEWLLRHLRIANAEIRVAHEELQRWQGRGQTSVSIGALPSASEYLVPSAVSRTLTSTDAICIVVKDGNYGALTQMLRNAQVDFVVGLLRGAGCGDDLEEECLFEDRFMAVVRPDHPALEAGRATPLRRLAAYPWIAPFEDTPSDHIFHGLFERHGLPQPSVRLRSYNIAVIRAALLNSDSVALLSPLQMHLDIQAGRLALASPSLVGSERAFGLTHRRGALPSPACCDVMATLKGIAKDALDLTRH